MPPLIRQANGPSYCSTCANPWCSICRHNYSQAASVDAVRTGFGDSYYYDSVAQLLHIRVVPLSAFRNYPYFGTVANNPLVSSLALLSIFVVVVFVVVASRA
jgi:hypothetical protein